MTGKYATVADTEPSRLIEPVALYSDVDGCLGNHGSRQASDCMPYIWHEFRKKMPETTGFVSGKPLEYLKKYSMDNGLDVDFLVGENGGIIRVNGDDAVVYQNGDSVARFKESVSKDYVFIKEIPWHEETGKQSIFTMFPDDARNAGHIKRLEKYASERIGEMGLDLAVIRHLDCIDVMPAGLSKEHGVRVVAEKLGFDPACAMAIGDGRNDIELLGSVGLPAAPGNAHDDIKKIVASKNGIVASASHGDGVLEIYNSIYQSDL